jgi:uncharacterized protein YraI
MISENKRSPIFSAVIYIVIIIILAVGIYLILEYLENGTITIAFPTSLPQPTTNIPPSVTPIQSQTATPLSNIPTPTTVLISPTLEIIEPPDSSPPTPTSDGVPGSIIPTPVPGFPFVTANENVNIRTGPGVDYDNIGILKEGENAAIIAYSNDSTWWAVRYPNPPLDIGWVSADYVTQTGDVTIVPTPAPGAPILTAAANLNIRSGPGIEFDKIGLILIGQSAEVVGISKDSEWWAIKVPLAEGGRGWVTANFAQVGNAQEVPVIE